MPANTMPQRRRKRHRMRSGLFVGEKARIERPGVKTTVSNTQGRSGDKRKKRRDRSQAMPGHPQGVCVKRQPPHKNFVCHCGGCG